MVSSHLPKTTHSLLPPPSPRRQAVDAVFLSSSSLPLPFLFLKKIAARQKGPSCRRSLAAQRAQQGATGFRNPFLGKAWAAGHIQKLPRHQRGASSGASRCNSRHLARRRNTPALIPNSQNHVSIQTPDADTVATTVFPTTRPLSSSHAPTWGPCPALPFPRLG